MMKIGFSSLVCPTWNLQTIVTRASEMGFAGVELRGLNGELHLPVAPELAADPQGVRAIFAEKRVELVCLGASATLTSKDAQEAARQKATVIEFLELAAKLQCPSVRIFIGDVGKRDNHRLALGRTVEALSSIAGLAARLEVTVLIENGGDFSSSHDLWFIIDAVGSPWVAACWNQCHARTTGERPTTSIPRLGRKIGMVHICDAKFDESGALLEYKSPGDGDVEVRREIELLKGVIYDGYLMFEWPKLWIDSLPAPEAVLPGVVKFLKAALEAKQPVLSAYKGDKNAPRFRAPSGSASPAA
jgi:sugar phosphate isomerase/epimerase